VLVNGLLNILKEEEFGFILVIYYSSKRCFFLLNEYIE
jgi:hypothetical protein